MVGGSEGFSPRPSQTDDKCKQIVGESRDEKETLFPVVGRKERLREFQRSREEPLKCKLLRVKYFRASVNTHRAAALQFHVGFHLCLLYCVFIVDVVVVAAIGIRH